MVQEENLRADLHHLRLSEKSGVLNFYYFDHVVALFECRFNNAKPGHWRLDNQQMRILKVGDIIDVLEHRIQHMLREVFFHHQVHTVLTLVWVVCADFLTACCQVVFEAVAIPHFDVLTKV